jgi:hypothetical protein
MHPFGTIGLYSNSGGVSPPSNGWLTPPILTDTTMNGLTDACGMFCNVLDIGDRNYFSCRASGAYTVSVYTSVGGTLISRQNIAANIQCNWQIDWSACTHNVDVNTRQAYTEITPQAGQSLTSLLFNTDNPAETNTNSSAYIAGLFYRLPALTNATNMHVYNTALQSVTHGNYPALVNAINMHYYNISLQSVTHGNYPALSNAINMHIYNTALQSVTHGNYPALTDATNMHYSNSALQSVTHGNYPALSNAINMHVYNISLQSCYFGGLSALVTCTGMFGTTDESTCCRSLRKLITIGLGSAFAAATTFTLRYTAIQEPEALAWVSSLGSSANTITFDLRNNPFSTSALVAPAILAKFPNATVTL